MWDAQVMLVLMKGKAGLTYASHQGPTLVFRHVSTAALRPGEMVIPWQHIREDHLADVSTVHWLQSGQSAERCLQETRQ